MRGVARRSNVVSRASRSGSRRSGMIAMTAMVAWQVFSRYVLNASPSWTEAGLDHGHELVHLPRRRGRRARELPHGRSTCCSTSCPTAAKLWLRGDLRRRGPRLRPRHDRSTASQLAVQTWTATHPGARPAGRLRLHAARRGRRADRALRPRTAGAARRRRAGRSRPESPKTSRSARSEPWNSTVLFGVFVALMLIGTPIAFCLGISSFATVLYLGLPPLVVFQRARLRRVGLHADGDPVLHLRGRPDGARRHRAAGSSPSPAR